MNDVREIAETCFKDALEQHGATIKEEAAWNEDLEDGGAIKRYVLHQPPEVAHAVELSADRRFFDATRDESLRYRRGDALVSVIGTTGGPK